MTIETGQAAPVPRVITLDLAAGVYQALLRGRPETAGMRSGLVVLESGASVGKHNTGAHEEQLVVLEGEGEFRADGAGPLAIDTRSVVYCPPHCEHDVVNTGQHPLRYIYVVAEAR
jgi:quercetin dioxygenase-like cupin family protein